MLLTVTHDRIWVWSCCIGEDVATPQRATEGDRAYSYVDVGLCSFAPIWKVPSNVQVPPQPYIFWCNQTRNAVGRKTKFPMSRMTTSVLHVPQVSKPFQRKGMLRLSHRFFARPSLPSLPYCSQLSTISSSFSLWANCDMAHRGMC